MPIITEKQRSLMYRRFNKNKTVKLLKRMTPRRKMYALVINVISNFPQIKLQNVKLNEKYFGTTKQIQTLTGGSEMKRLKVIVQNKDMVLKNNNMNITIVVLMQEQLPNKYYLIMNVKDDFSFFYYQILDYRNVFNQIILKALSLVYIRQVRRYFNFGNQSYVPVVDYKMIIQE